MTTSNEYTNDELPRALYELSLRVSPSAGLFRATLEKLPLPHVPEKVSPPTLSPLIGMPWSFWKIGLPAIAVLFIVTGLTLSGQGYLGFLSSTSPTRSPTPVATTNASVPDMLSDAAFGQDLADIDAETLALNADAAAADQALDHQKHFPGR